MTNAAVLIKRTAVARAFQHNTLVGIDSAAVAAHKIPSRMVNEGVNAPAHFASVFVHALCIISRYVKVKK
jgi:hypothetical protein